MEKVPSKQPADLVLYLQVESCNISHFGKCTREETRVIKGTFTDLPPTWSVTGEATDVAFTALDLEST